MSEFAERWIKTIEDLAPGEFNWDYSEESVTRLDEFIDTRLWDPEGPRPTEAELTSNSILIGAYLGEVMIRNIGGEWAVDYFEGNKQPVVKIGSLAAFAPNKVYKRQVLGRQESLVAFYNHHRDLARRTKARDEERS